MKIVIRVPNWIGDSILAIPAIESISRNYSGAQIWVVTKGWVKDLFNSYSFIKGVIPLSETNNDLKNLNKSAQRLKKLNFDAGVLLTNSFVSAFLFYLAKIPQRWGYSKDGRGILLTKGVALRKNKDSSHQINYYLDLISGLGIKTIPPQLSLPLTQEEKQKARETLLSLNIDLNQPLLILHPGASYGPAKRWPVTKYAELAALLQVRKKANILLVGSSEDTELAESIVSSMTKKPFNLAGNTSLRLLAGLISQANLFITNDSGPMHMANALKIPVVAIFGPTDPKTTGPFQEPAIVIKKDAPCWPCRYRECPFDHRCMINIHSEEVFQACQQYL
jgi:heptosyltransferase-2